MNAPLKAGLAALLLLTGCTDTLISPPHISASYQLIDLGGGADVLTVGNPSTLSDEAFRNWVADAMPSNSLGRRVLFTPVAASNGYRRMVWHFSGAAQTRTDQLCGGLPEPVAVRPGEPLYVSVGFCLGPGTSSGARGQIPWTGSLDGSDLRALISQMTLYIFPLVNPLDRDGADPAWRSLR